jgi:hypothetical protein
MNGKDRNFFRKMARRENPIRAAMYLPGVNLDEIAWRATREEILFERLRILRDTERQRYAQSLAIIGAKPLIP